MGFIAATFLRLDNIGMTQRRDAVLAADKAGDENAIRSRLYDLQRYSSSHMNSDTGVFYLENQYKRDSQKALDAASQYDDPNGNVNVKADAVCKPQYTAWSEAYVQCFADELAKFPPAPNPAEQANLPSSALYRYVFISPLWFPDFAGFSVLVCIAVSVVIVGRLVSLGILRLLLKRHYRGI